MKLPSSPPDTHALAVSTYRPLPPLLRITRQDGDPTPRPPKSGVESSITRNRVGGGLDDVPRGENGDSQSGDTREDLDIASLVQEELDDAVQLQIRVMGICLR
jgi:hypothetical protein